MRKTGKKVLGIVLCAAMAGSLLAGCGKKQGTEAVGGGQETTAAAREQSTEQEKTAQKGNVPTIRLVSWQTPSDPKTKPVYDAVDQFAKEHASEFKLEHENILGDELKAKIDVYKRQGMEILLKAGAASIEHATYLDPEINEQIIRQGVYVVPTFTPYEIAAASEVGCGIVPDAIFASRAMIGLSLIHICGRKTISAGKI